MGRDSFSLEQSLWIRNAIAVMLTQPCACYIYNGSYDCVRCEDIARAEKLFPIQHSQAVNAWKARNGI